MGIRRWGCCFSGLSVGERFRCPVGRLGLVCGCLRIHCDVVLSRWLCGEGKVSLAGLRLTAAELQSCDVEWWLLFVAVQNGVAQRQSQRWRMLSDPHVGFGDFKRHDLAIWTPEQVNFWRISIQHRNQEDNVAVRVKLMVRLRKKQNLLGLSYQRALATITARTPSNIFPWYPFLFPPLPLLLVLLRRRHLLIRRNLRIHIMLQDLHSILTKNITRATPHRRSRHNTLQPLKRHL